MADAQHEMETYVSHIAFPTTKEGLINGLPDITGHRPLRTAARGPMGHPSAGYHLTGTRPGYAGSGGRGGTETG